MDDELLEVDKDIKKYIYAVENKDKIDAYLHWLSYLGGFSGQGTTALDIMPDVVMPNDLPCMIRMHLASEMLTVCLHRANIFRQSTLETLGEDLGRPIISKALENEFESALKDVRDINALKRIILEEADVITSRMEVINNSFWSVFKSWVNGEFKRLHKRTDLLFEEFDKLTEQQIGKIKEKTNGT